jgi:hypothetical protein
MIFLHPPEEGKPGIGKVQRVVQPFFADVALYDTGEYDRRGMHGKNKADRGRDKKQRKNVLQFSADVLSIEWAHMMIPVEWIEPFVQESSDEALTRRETAVQNITMEEIFNESPGHATCRKKSYRGPGMACRKREGQHDDGIDGVKGGKRIETVPSQSGLAPLVGCERDFRSYPSRTNLARILTLILSLSWILRANYSKLPVTP